jgi:hypothetical protein
MTTHRGQSEAGARYFSAHRKLMMGLFDLPAPLLSMMDGSLRAVLPQWLCLVVWGGLTGTASILIYRAASPQRRIEEISKAAEQARVAMRRYDGPFNGLLSLARRSLGLSMRHLFLALGPAVAASLPALFLIGYLDNAYGYAFPRPGAAVAVRIDPNRAVVAWNPQDAVDGGGGGVWTVKWPGATSPVTVSTAQGVRLATFPMREPVPEMRKFRSWNFLYGNPAGYLPADAAISAITVEMAQNEYLPVGPGWLRGWETVFFLSAALFSISIKFSLGVH